MPDRLKQHGSQSKVALRQAFAADLPPEILNRGKAGFGVPISKWFRHDLRQTAADVLLDPSSTARGQFNRGTIERLLADHTNEQFDHGERIWSLLMLELWQRRYVDQIPTSDQSLAP
jgi:asparagine synthase (glutamine-hydrolysing)